MCPSEESHFLSFLKYKYKKKSFSMNTFEQVCRRNQMFVLKCSIFGWNLHFLKLYEVIYIFIYGI